MAFNIIMTDGGQSDYNHCLDYLFYTLENAQATQNLLVDIEDAIIRLQENALSYPICEDGELAKIELRKIHLRKHSYKIFYKVVKDKVYIEAILHDKQDTKKWLLA